MTNQLRDRIFALDTTFEPAIMMTDALSSSSLSSITIKTYMIVHF